MARGYDLLQKWKCLFRDLSDHTLEIIYDAWWASMNVGSKLPIAWNDSRHAPSGRFYLHCGIDETGSPGIICILCHHVLRHPSEHGTSSMGNTCWQQLTSQNYTK
jgi:hypothetical protein